jgi:hypothetical protein
MSGLSVGVDVVGDRLGGDVGVAVGTDVGTAVGDDVGVAVTACSARDKD